MRLRTRFCLLALLGSFLGPQLLGAQDTTAAPGVRLGLNYEAGTKPGVIVFPVRDDHDDDSLRVIVQRDLDYSDRMNVIALDNETLSGLVPAAGEKINFDLVGKFGAALLVRMTPTNTGLHVSAYDVSRKQLLQSEHFLFDRRDRDWRFTLHGISDQIEQWVFGKRGIAQTRIAYVNNGTLQIVDSDGARTRTITTGKGHSHPRGRQTANRSCSPYLGTTVLRCRSSTSVPGASAGSVRFAPDSTSRRFTSRMAAASCTRRERETART